MIKYVVHNAEILITKIYTTKIVIIYNWYDKSLSFFVVEEVVVNKNIKFLSKRATPAQ